MDLKPRLDEDQDSSSLLGSAKALVSNITHHHGPGFRGHDSDDVVMTEEEEAAEERQRSIAENIQIKPGDYQIIVHVIEAKDLHGDHADGIC